eukprot:6776869-Prymnesium_polylepis.1
MRTSRPRLRERIANATGALRQADSEPTTAALAANAYPETLGRKASPRYSPALHNETLLGGLVTAFDAIYILCFKHTCAVHRPSGDSAGRRVWWDAVQPRVNVFDGADIDRQHAHLFEGFNLEPPPDATVKRRRPLPVGRRLDGKDWARKDWNRNVLHRLRPLMAHLALVDHAARRELGSVLILEADFVRAALSEYLVQKMDRAAGVAAPDPVAHASAARKALWTHPWSLFRLGGIPYNYARTGQKSTVCTSACRCEHWSGSSVMDAVAKHPRFCVVKRANATSYYNATVMPPHVQWPEYRGCDFRDSSGYAVHASAFPQFRAFLEELKRNRHLWFAENGNAVPFIDVWLPHAFDSLYVLPSLVAQASRTQSSPGIMAQRKTHDFERRCYRVLTSGDAPTRRDLRGGTRGSLALRKPSAAAARGSTGGPTATGGLH